MPYIFVADSFHTKKLWSRLSLCEVRFCTENGRYAFLSLGPTYDDHLRLIGKRILDFLLVLIEVFLLGVTAETLWASVQNGLFCSNGGQLTQNFRWKGSPPTNHSSSQKTRLNDLLYGIKIWTDLSSVLSQCTRLTDRQNSHRQTACAFHAAR